MWQKLLQLVNSTEYDLKERMLRSIILVGELACILASVEIFLVMDINNVMLTILVLMIMFMVGIFFVTFKFKRYELASTLLGAVIVSFPTVTSVMMYNYVADGYAVAFFLACLAAR